MDSLSTSSNSPREVPSNDQIAACLRAVDSREAELSPTLRYCVERGYAAVISDEDMVKRRANFSELQRDAARLPTLNDELASAKRDQNDTRKVVADLSELVEGSGPQAALRRLFTFQDKLAQAGKRLSEQRASLKDLGNDRAELEKRIDAAKSANIPQMERELAGYNQIPSLGWAGLTARGHEVLRRLEAPHEPGAPEITNERIVAGSELLLGTVLAARGPQEAHRQLVAKLSEFSPEALAPLAVSIAEAYHAKGEEAEIPSLVSDVRHRAGRALPQLLLGIESDLEDVGVVERILHMCAPQLDEQETLSKVATAFARGAVIGNEYRAALRLVNAYQHRIDRDSRLEILADIAEHLDASDLPILEGSITAPENRGQAGFAEAVEKLCLRYLAEDEPRKAWAIAARYTSELSGRRESLATGFLLKVTDSDHDAILRDLIRKWGAALDPQSVQDALYRLYDNWDGENSWSITSLLCEARDGLKQRFPETADGLHDKMIDDNLYNGADELLRTTAPSLGDRLSRMVERQADAFGGDSDYFQEWVQLLKEYGHALQPDELENQFDSVCNDYDTSDSDDRAAVESLLIAIAPSLGNNLGAAVADLIEDDLDNDDYQTAIGLLSRLETALARGVGKLASDIAVRAADNSYFDDALETVQRFRRSMDADQMKDAVDALSTAYDSDSAAAHPLASAILESAELSPDRGEQLLRENVCKFVDGDDLDVLAKLAQTLPRESRPFFAAEVHRQYERAIRDGLNCADELRQRLPQYCE